MAARKAAKKSAPASKATKASKAVAKAPSRRRTGGREPPPPPPPEAAEEPASPEADAVFIGTVLQTASSSVAEVEPAADTVVVRVDEVVSGAQAFHDHIGEPVTVALPDGVTVAEGDVHVFHVMAWIFGSGLAVRAVSVGDHAALAAAQGEPATAEARVRARVASADRVVSGVVRQVRHVPVAEDHPITEHDPLWNDATVDVHGERGRAAEAGDAGPVTVRFASSRDIRWYTAPKFSVGDRGVWLLGAPQPALPGVAALVAGLAPDHYLVVDPDDFQPADDAPTLMAELDEGGDGR